MRAKAIKICTHLIRKILLCTSMLITLCVCSFCANIVFLIYLIECKRGTNIFWKNFSHFARPMVCCCGLLGLSLSQYGVGKFHIFLIMKNDFFVKLYETCLISHNTTSREYPIIYLNALMDNGRLSLRTGKLN
jgi:hypothetical protein